MITNTFDKSPEGWCSYDYHWSIVSGGRNIFILATQESSGGVNDSGFIWTDHTQWSADTPENPMSILPMLLYRNWVGAEPANLLGAKVSVFLRGDNLQLDGANCYFWVHSGHCRWHFDSQPLSISEGQWALEPNAFDLTDDQSKWRMSWSRNLSSAKSLNDTLSHVQSYGFSFVGFQQEPKGKFSIDEFNINPTS